MTLDNIDRIYEQELERFVYQLKQGIINQATFEQELRDLHEWATEAEKEILS